MSSQEINKLSYSIFSLIISMMYEPGREINDLLSRQLSVWSRKASGWTSGTVSLAKREHWCWHAIYQWLVWVTPTWMNRLSQFATSEPREREKKSLIHDMLRVQVWCAPCADAKSLRVFQTASLFGKEIFTRTRIFVLIFGFWLSFLVLFDAQELVPGKRRLRLVLREGEDGQVDPRVRGHWEVPRHDGQGPDQGRHSLFPSSSHSEQVSRIAEVWSD